MNKWLLVVGMITVLGWSGFLFYQYWSELQAEQIAAQQQLIQQKEQTDKIAQEQQTIRQKRNQADAEVDAKTLENVKIVNELVKKYYEKAGYVPSVMGHLSFVAQGVFDTAVRPGESERRVLGVLYTWRGGTAYELCADFMNESSADGPVSDWSHTDGNYCFQRSVGTAVVDQIKQELQ